MVLPSVFAAAADRAVPLSSRTSMRIGGAPEFFFEPTSDAEVAEVVAACRRERVPLRVLGGGCNLLVADGRIEGAVLSTARLRYERVHDDRVEVSAGTPFPGLVTRAAALGIPHLSGCPGIPGSVGGVVAMNAGGRFGCVADAIVEVSGVDLDGTPFRRRVEPGDFGYRTTVFLGAAVVTSAAFVRDAHLDREAERRRLVEASAWKRATQPLSAASAGCVFKNPDGRSAGQTIDTLGLKGQRVGPAVVSTLHANFIVNEGGARFADVASLIDRLTERVRDATGTTLELEVRVWR